MKAECGSHMKWHLPFFSVTCHVDFPFPVIDVSLLTVGPAPHGRTGDGSTLAGAARPSGVEVSPT
jgi:hypothetical protein